MKAIVRAESAEGPQAVLRDVPIPKCGPKDILVAVKAVASNPTDWKKLERTPEYGLILGCDFAGVVDEVGSQVLDSKKRGDRVAGFLHGGVQKDMGGCFAEYCLVNPELVVLLPNSLSFEEAAGIGISAFTACQVLFQKHAGITPLKPLKEKRYLLIWGGATALGMYAIQLGKLAGYDVIATASPSNFEKVKALGASAAFNYRDADVSQQIRRHTEDKLAFAVDCISEKETPRLVANTIGVDGGEISFVLGINKDDPSLRKDVKLNEYLVYKLNGREWHNPFHWPFNQEYYDDGKTYAKLLSQLFAEGRLKAPPMRMMPNGLSSIPDGLAYTKAGQVSGVKLTYTI